MRVNVPSTGESVRFRLARKRVLIVNVYFDDIRCVTGRPNKVPQSMAPAYLAVTFGAIHFCTQYFEQLDATPEAFVVAGVIAILAAWGFWAFNRGLARHPLTPCRGDVPVDVEKLR